MLKKVYKYFKECHKISNAFFVSSWSVASFVLHLRDEVIAGRCLLTGTRQPSVHIPKWISYLNSCKFARIRMHFYVNSYVGINVYTNTFNVLALNTVLNIFGGFICITWWNMLTLLKVWQLAHVLYIIGNYIVLFHLSTNF